MAEFDAFGKKFDFWVRTVRGSPHYKDWLSLIPPYSHRVLDAGCGSGLLSVFLADRSNVVVGIDISKTMIALAEKRRVERGKNNVHFVIGDLESISFQERSFDLVVTDTALGQIRLQSVIPRLRRMVKQEGRLILRELVSPHPKLDRSPLWVALRNFKAAPGYVRHFGLRAAHRMLSFQLSPSWIRHECDVTRHTPDAFRTIYSRLLPGCRFKDFGWTMAALWEPSFTTHLGTPDSDNRSSVSDIKTPNNLR